jgi:hypothetical protein
MDVTSLLESEQEMLAFIQSNNRGGVRTTLKTLLEKMERKPYGWYYAAILCILAKLCARGKVEVRTDSNPLEDDDLDRALRNTHGHANVVLEPQVDFTASQVRSLKEFYQDFFDSPPFSNEAKALGKETGAALQELLHQLTPLAAQVAQYPFLTALHPVMDRLKDIIGKPYTWYLTELLRQEDALIDLKEKIIDPIRKFMGGPLKDIFNEARKFVQAQEPNFSYLTGDESAQVISALTDPECFVGKRMQQVKTNVSTLQGRVEVHVAEEIAKANKVLAGLQKNLCTMPEFTVLSPSQQSQITKPFADIVEQVGKQTLIAVIRDTPRRFEETEYPQLLSRVTAWSQTDVNPIVTDSVDYKSSPTPVAVPTMTEPPIKYVSSRLVRVSFDKPWLADESDVDRYLDSMREALLTEIRSGKRIQI